jgi:hypothetical protein
MRTLKWKGGGEDSILEEKTLICWTYLKTPFRNSDVACFVWNEHKLGTKLVF